MNPSRAVQSSNVNMKHYVDQLEYRKELAKNHSNVLRGMLINSRNINYRKHMPWLSERN